MNTFDWLSALELPDVEGYDLVEVSFKNGSHKDFFHNQAHHSAQVGDDVVVEAGSGYNIGRITLAGELVKMQLKKKRVRDNTVFGNIIRKANNRDIERLEEARSREREVMVRARAIARMLDLDMKIGDVEFQGDNRKATFFYTANGRVDFRELIRHFAKEFRVKIEMRQIGARQESARVGGLGSCGRELCCSTWLTDFKSVNTAAARYQNLAINQAKLSGQCGRLKCCLNFELDTYVDALEKFPKKADRLFSKEGTASLLKIDIFKKQMYYVLADNANGRTKVVVLEAARVVEVLEMNRRQEKPDQLVNIEEIIEKKADMDFADVTGEIELPEMERRSRSRRKNRNKRNNDEGRPARQGREDEAKSDSTETETRDNNQGKQNRTDRNRPPRDKRDRPPRSNNQGDASNDQQPARPPKPRYPERRDRPPRSNEQGKQANDQKQNRPPKDNDASKGGNDGKPPFKGNRRPFDKKKKPPTQD
jgi:cell fate regulator YaaT (PSP1 superfamily)